MSVLWTPLAGAIAARWNGSEWVPIPAAPKTPLTAHNYFQILLITVVVIGVLAYLSQR